MQYTPYTLLLLTASCGNLNLPTQQNTPTNSTSYTSIPTLIELPDCDKSTQQLVYVEEMNVFYNCSKTGWQKIDLVPKVQPTKIVETIACSAVLDETILVVQYNVSILSSGDSFISVVLQDGVSQDSTTNFHPKGQPVTISIQSDKTGDNSFGTWTFNFNSKNSTLSVTYTDTNVKLDWVVESKYCKKVKH